jgi:6-pyruvoyltetrahydropterin/6-carboxytetrahydropterin synthase
VRGQVIDQWDHSDLNLVLDNPTAELLAARAWELLAEAGIPLVGIRLWETPQSWVELVAEDGGGEAGSTHAR